ncbi:pyruvate dehydrogenase (acetyl-transferring) E1 component subunit alpha [Nitriliruptoraceae bacterium ZYF776]|nr:pyruvate dehydrogenase (acetyl-transferring) E1 component subunit alpha [Profundirhabdus halotolerans]
MSEPRGTEFLPTAEPVHLVDPDGTYHEDPSLGVDLDDEGLRDLYRRMVVTRKLDREAINLQRQGQLGVYASCLGQEAAQVGSAAALAREDWIFPSYRELGAAVTRDVDAGGLLHLYRGTWLSDHDPYAHNFGLLSIPIGTQALHATGFAMGARLDDNPLVALTYFGDGGTSEGDPHEAMNFAAVFDAPVIFFVQNNQYAISVPLSKQTKAPSLAHKAVGYGMPGERVDGNDVLATYAVTKRAVDRARRGEGPTFIEAMTYRMEAHTTSDDPSRYRSKEELEEAAKTDPIARMRNFLAGRGLHDDALESECEDLAKQQSAALRESVYDAPHGDPMELFEHVYVDPTGYYEDQAAQLRAELDAQHDGKDA